MSGNPIEILEHFGIRPTSNRILVVKALLEASSPQSLIELETILQTLERSSISRVLAILLEHHVVHIMEDGRGVSKYELCHSGHGCSPNDMHAHFYCEECHNVTCLEDIKVLKIDLPEEFKIKSVNFMLKGVCPDCGKKLLSGD